MQGIQPATNQRALMAPAGAQPQIRANGSTQSLAPISTPHPTEETTMTTASESLQRLTTERKLMRVTTHDRTQPTEFLYLVEVVGSPGNVCAQGFGGSLESAEAECLKNLSEELSP